MMSKIVSSALLYLIIQHATATDDELYGSTRGCNSACQRECIEVINKYRLNHNAKGVKFSQFLANKAQRWADGGKFGYDMKSRRKYGQLIEWDVKDELQNFTNVIKHWHDKERDFDFASGRSKTGKTLHDFTQIVWKKAKKAGCGQSEIFGSKYYVVWMDSDGVVSPNIEVDETNIGSPKMNDLHWFERANQSTKRKSTHVVPLRPQDADSSTRGRVEPESPINALRGGDEHGKPAGHPDLNEVREEQKVLNNNALLKQYLFHDTLNNVVLNENKETASYHVVPGAEDSANWQKGAESLIQLDHDKGNTNHTSPTHGMTSLDNTPTSSSNGMTSPIRDGEDDDSKQAARFQSLVIQDDDMLTKSEEDGNGTVSTEASDSDDIAEGDEYQQAAIQSMMKQEDDMIQNEEPADDEELSGGTPPPGKATFGTSNKVAPNDVNGKSYSKPSTKSNEAFVINITEDHQGEDGKSFYTSGVALNNNPNETNTFTASNNKPTLDLFKGSANSSLRNDEIRNQSTASIRPGTPPDSLSKERHGSDENEDQTKGRMQTSGNSLLKNNKTINKIKVNTSQSAILNYDNLSNQEKTMQQSKSKENAPTSSVSISSNSSNDMEQVVNMASTPKASSSQGKLIPGEIQAEKKPFSSNMRPRLTLTEMITPGVKINPVENSPSIPQTHYTPGPLEQTVTALVSHLPTSAASGSQKAEQSMLTSGTKPHNGQSTESNTAIQSPVANSLDASSHDSDLHHVNSPALITLPNSSSRPIKLVFHVQDMKSKGVSPNTQISGSQGSDDNQSASVLNVAADMVNNEECHDDTLQCHLWAHHGHCRGTAYAEFMRRHCKATCGYCGLPSVIKESENHKKAQSVAQDEPCQDMPKYQFSCPRWQAQGYCEKKENEMKMVCKRTCGFCVADPVHAPNKAVVSQHSPLQANTEASKTSSKSSQDKHLTKETESSPSKNQDDQILTVGAKNVHNFTLKSVGQTLVQKNRTSLLDQSGPSTPSSLPREQGVPIELNNFIKRPIKFGLSHLNGAELQSSLFPAGNRVNSQNYRSQGEDNLIMEGIEALKHRLQAPVHISAVAKSNPACGQRLCKEKVKTQEAKTRETIGDQALVDVASARKTEERPVSTTGCNSSCQQECLAAHNRYRLNHGASPLILNQTLADQAQQWADKKVFKHSPWAGGQGGETIALGSLYPSFTAAVKAWHDEEKDFDWSTGTAIGDMKVNHFTQVVWKGAHLLGCGKTIVNGEPYYIAQMDTPGVIAGVPGFDKSNVGEPKEPDLNWFMDSSPYWKEMQTKDAIPKNIEHRIL